VSSTWIIVGRNLRLFFRDRMNVFFSLLGAIVLFLLYVLFLGNVQSQALAATLPQASVSDIQAFVDSWMFAGIVLLTTVTTGLGALAVLIEDGESGRFRDFLVSPIPRWNIVLGYLLASAVVALIVSLFVLAVSVLYLGLVRGAWLPIDEVLRAAGIVTLSSIAFAAVWSFVASFVRTTGAFSALSAIVGTLLGFVAGAYLPVGLLPAAVGDSLNALPFAQAGVLLRQAFTAETLPAMTGGVAEADDAMSRYYGIEAYVGDWQVPVWYIFAVLAVMLVAFTALSALRIRARIR
jgi:multidrug/hemolysin transport system permease protein